MTDTVTLSAYGELIEPMTVRLERMLPGPVERVWSYLTDSNLRGQWLATGDMPRQPGAKVELVWRNDDLSGRQEQRPADVPAERRMACEVIRAEVYSVDDLLAHGSEAAIKAAGKLRVEGRDYVMRDSDVAHFLIGK